MIEFLAERGFAEVEVVRLLEENVRFSPARTRVG
jgi:hypothetical protein